MLQLYYGSGSREVELVNLLQPQTWPILKRQALRFLEESGQKDAADFLTRLPFALWEATNGFGDEFLVLYASVSIPTYLQLEENKPKYVAEQVAETFQKLNKGVRFVAIDATTEDSPEEVEAVAAPTLATKSAAVLLALKDVEILLRESGAVSGLDRIHTALHGYLLDTCKEEKITLSSDPDVTTLLSLIKQRHPKLQNTPGQNELTKVLRGFGQVVDALNPLRNHNSLAHPNQELMGQAEALLVINATRTIMSYLNSKLDN